SLSRPPPPDSVATAELLPELTCSRSSSALLAALSDISDGAINLLGPDHAPCRALVCRTSDQPASGPFYRRPNRIPTPGCRNSGLSRLIGAPARLPALARAQ